MIQGLLFDKDGTILDFYKSWIPINRAMTHEIAGGDAMLARELLRAGGHDPDTNIIAPNSVLGSSGVEAIAECFAAILEDRTPTDLMLTIAKHFRQGGAKYSILIDGVFDQVKVLRNRGYRLGIATSDTVDGLHASLRRHEGLIDVFEFLVGCDSGFGSKPSPQIGAAFAEAAGLEPSGCAIIGDTTCDLETGRLAGFGLRVGVLTGLSLRRDLEPYADFVIPSVCQLRHLLNATSES